MIKRVIALLFLLWGSVAIIASDFIYKVKSGESIVEIARENLKNPSDWRKLLKYNQIVNPSLVKPGDTLKIPASLYKGNSSSAGAPIAVVVFLRGKVKYKVSDKKSEWKGVRVGQKLYSGYVVRTKEKASAEINFFNKPSTVIVMRENSIIKIKREKVKGIELSFGDLYIRTMKTNLKDVKFTVKTTSSAAAIRGTEFGVSVDDKKTDRYRCLKGEISVAAAKKTVYVKAGYGTLVKKGQAPMTPFKLLGAIKTKPIEGRK
ncbi:MAG: FecR domain-containing protein [Spirochaetota bacterium]